ncbi:beta-glucosidase [Acrasis kona]|uniref:Probable beta-glucosidase G n=1 Tax=Acrasis kona TaxID=1008807 RepID=A0AAW2YLU3_9EUKA
MKTLLLLLILIPLIYTLNLNSDAEKKARELLSKMTLEEKLEMVKGHGTQPYVGMTPENKRLNIPPLNMEDGPQGVADGVHFSTCWPSALTVVSTWDVNLMYKWAAAMAQEQFKKGTNVMLGPMVNIARVPHGGRNFESFGEDPVLASAMVGPYVKGVQSQNVIANVKHFVNNNQEIDRNTVSANVDDRTQWEVYYPAFQAAIDAGVGSVMCSYNKINTTWACENEKTLGDLKNKLNLRGWVMSDWGATHSTVKAANAGLDQEMPDDKYFGKPLVEAINKGEVTKERLDDMVYRMLLPMQEIGLFDNRPTGNLSVDTRSQEHSELARILSESSHILLKNDNRFLPLNDSYQSIAVIGYAAHDKLTIAGGGSGHVIPESTVSPLDGIKKKFTSSNVQYANGNDLQSAVYLAKTSQVAIVVVEVGSSEGDDRRDLKLPNNQDTLVFAICSAQPNCVVVLHVVGSVVMPWIKLAKSVITATMPGQQAGEALANILYGDVNPSGRLPITYTQNEKDIPVNSQKQWPGVDLQSDYSEQLLVGYRWYDTNKKDPLFAFGHGLSYSDFQYINFKTERNGDNLKLKVDIKNLSPRDGHEVVQIYLGFPKDVNEPVQQLKGFVKVFVKAGETVHVEHELTPRDFSIWDVVNQKYSVVLGQYNIRIGSSSRDVRVAKAIKY